MAAAAVVQKPFSFEVVFVQQYYHQSPGLVHRFYQDTDIKHVNGNQSSGTDIEAPLTPEQDLSPVVENHASEQTVVSAEVNGEEALNPLDNGGVSVAKEEVPAAEVVDEEIPVAEVVDEAPDDSPVVCEANSKIEEVLKKSYGPIVTVHENLREIYWYLLLHFHGLQLSEWCYFFEDYACGWPCNSYCC